MRKANLKPDAEIRRIYRKVKPVDMEKYEEAKNILERLETTTAPTHPLLVELRTRYDFETINWEE